MKKSKGLFATLSMAMVISPLTSQAALPEFLGVIDSAVVIQDIASDGETIAGRIPNPNNSSLETPVKWHLGIVSELNVTTSRIGSALAISQDASFLAGYGAIPLSSTSPVMWNALGEPFYVPFSELASIRQARVNAVSNDGSRLAISGYGVNGIDAYLYQVGTGYLWNADMDGWNGLYMSADGKALSWGNSASAEQYGYWHENSGFSIVDIARAGVSWKAVKGISADGATVFGWVNVQDYCDGICSSGTVHSRPFFWSLSHGAHLVPWYNGNYVPTSISDDGRVMIILAGDNLNPVNLIWHDADDFGLRNWNDVMRDEYEVDWNGWSSVQPLKVSGTGSDITFIGSGYYNGNRSIWRVSVNYNFSYPAKPSDSEFELLSRNPQGYPGFAGGTKHSASRDGNVVVFLSKANNLDTEAVTNGRNFKVFARDHLNNTATALKHNGAVLQSSTATYSPALSGDSDWIAFGSGGQMILFNRVQQTSSVISKNAQGVENVGQVLDPQLSYDGRYLVYTIFSTNMAPEVPSQITSIVLFDRVYNTTELVSRTSSGEPANSAPSRPDVSDDGRFIVYTTAASNIVGSEANGMVQVVLFDRATGISKVVSSVNGSLGNDNSSSPTITGDGKFISYISLANNLIDIDANSGADVFRYDVENGTTQLVSSFNRFPSQGVIQEPGQIYSVSMSEDGQFIAFSKSATAFQDPAFNKGNIFVRDMKSAITHVVDSIEIPWQASSSNPLLTGDGASVIFSTSKPIMEPDLNGSESDILRVAVPQNRAPTVEINHPLDGAVFSILDDIDLAANATDEEGDLSLSIGWHSSIDGEITAPARLSAGNHILTAMVTDSLGQTGQAQVAVSVRETFEADLGAKLTKITTAWNVADHDLRLSILNGGLDQGQGVVATATLQAGATFVAARQAECQLSDQVATCTIDRLPAGEEATVVFSVLLADPKAKSTLTVDVTSASLDPAPDNNISSLRFGGSSSLFMLFFASALVWMRRGVCA